MQLSETLGEAQTEIDATSDVHRSFEAVERTESRPFFRASMSITATASVC